MRDEETPSNKPSGNECYRQSVGELLRTHSEASRRKTRALMSLAEILETYLEPGSEEESDIWSLLIGAL